MTDRDIGSICVFCGASLGNDPAYAAAAADLGTRIARNGIRLVFGAGHIGMMGTVADAVLGAGGEAVGVIPEFLRDRELAHQGLTELHVVASMHMRKQLMFDLSDAFVILPGGLGTMEEMFEMITWRQLGRHEKPVVLIDTNGYWQPFGDMVRQVVGSGFAHGDVDSYFTLVPDPAGAMALLLGA